LGSIFDIDHSLDVLGGRGGWVVICGLGGWLGLAGRVGVCGGDGDRLYLGTSCSKICCAIRWLSGLSGLRVLGAGPASGLGLRGNSPGAGLLIYCGSIGQRISKSKCSCSLILSSSSNRCRGRPNSRLVSSPAACSSRLALLICSISSCSVVASVLGGLTRSQVNLWYWPLLLLFWSYSSTTRLSRSTITSRVSGAAVGVGSVSLVHQVWIQALFCQLIFLGWDWCVGMDVYVATVELLRTSQQFRRQYYWV